MKKIIILVVYVIIFSSCANLNNGKLSEKKSNSADNSSTGLINQMDNSDTINNVVKFPIKTYAVYEVYNSNTIDNEFDQAMIANPIDKKMYEEIKTVDISGTRESQMFYDNYIKNWQDELAFSINNLKKYLSLNDLNNFKSSQTAWEENLESNNKFDRDFIGNTGVGLGTQYVLSSLIYLISQYRERVFHIKYMTMLAETYVDNSVPENECLWNKFLIW